MRQGKAGQFMRERRSRTRSESALPSTVLPSRRARAALMTAPICFGELAEVSAIAASMARSNRQSRTRAIATLPRAGLEQSA